MDKQCLAVAVLSALVFTVPAAVPAFNGFFQSGAVLYPDRGDVSSELRSRLQLEHDVKFSRTATLRAACRFDSLYSDRDEQATAVLPRLEELSLTLYLSHIDITLGYGKLYWGKLDQLPPTDVVNPLDMSVLFLKAERSAAKLPVTMLRISPYFEDESRLELIAVPRFKAAPWDELKEGTSPFFPLQTALPVKKRYPAHAARNAEYGCRFSTTSAEVDWSVCYFNGFQDLPAYRADAGGTLLHADYPRYETYGFDCEFVLGGWVVRGEGAYYLNRAYQAQGLGGYVPCTATTSGFGLFKRLSNTYLDFTFLRTSIDTDRAIEDQTDEISILANLESRFSYDTKLTRLFFIHNIRGKSLFVRGSYRVNVAENTWLELAIGNFSGQTTDLISRLKDNDYASVECRYDF